MRRCPGSPAASSSEAIEAAWPTCYIGLNYSALSGSSVALHGMTCCGIAWYGRHTMPWHVGMAWHGTQDVHVQLHGMWGGMAAWHGMETTLTGAKPQPVPHGDFTLQTLQDRHGNTAAAEELTASVATGARMYCMVS